MRSITRAAFRSAAAVVVLAGALTAHAGQASAAGSRTDGWSSGCDYGRACLWALNNWVYSAETCGYTYFEANQHFNWAKAHGNGFRVWYTNGTYDDVPAWFSRSLDGTNVVYSIWVQC